MNHSREVLLHYTPLHSMLVDWGIPLIYHCDGDYLRGFWGKIWQMTFDLARKGL